MTPPLAPTLTAPGPRGASDRAGDRVSEAGGVFLHDARRVFVRHGAKAKAGDLHLIRTIWALRDGADPERRRQRGKGRGARSRRAFHAGSRLTLSAVPMLRIIRKVKR